MRTNDGEFYDRIKSSNFTMGLRHVYVTLGLNDGKREYEMMVMLTGEDAVGLMKEIERANVIAWAQGKPSDVMPGESKPDWVKQFEDQGKAK